ncbi:hypothetical protein D7004_07475 [Pedobacter jejuensis]|uniref:Uncharacterized protein n=2 Tax=Pedobacter jejuensis TaxID=1268550 RepID=A0A3N0BY27_9SPHI|nr:hypothetical protein D7004_07475 [Pedobacter jejuensis]
MILAACNSEKSTRSFITGTYVSQSEGEYSIASDTLVIEASESNNYIIHRKTGFKRITEGKQGKLEYETEEWNALYDEGTNALTETKKGKVITFYPEANKLLVGKREYRKLGIK